MKDWETIHKVFVKKLMNEDVTATEVSEVEGISLKCSDDFGNGVHIARVIMIDYNNNYYDTNDDCWQSQTDPRSIKGKVQERHSFQVYPNPSSGLLNVTFENETSGTVMLVSLNGSIIEEMSLENQKDISFNSINENGIYYIKVFQNGQIPLLKKVIILK